MMKKTILSGMLMALSLQVQAGGDGKIVVDYSQKGASVNPRMYGIFFEEINHSGDGALYAELLRNRNFEEAVLPSGTIYRDGYAYCPHLPNYADGKYTDWKIAWNPDSLKMIGWHVDGDAVYDITDECQLHPNTPHAIRMEMKQPGVKLVNEGYWGVPVKKDAAYDLRFYACPNGFKGNVSARILSEHGEVLAEKTFALENSGWKEFQAVLVPKASDSKGWFALEFSDKGKVYVDYVSLFPQDTFKGRKNGLRKDLAQMLADLKPGFMRWPGGCIVEGMTYENHMDWKKTLGDPMQRHSEWILWNYHCSWGFGYHEFLQFCEDIGCDAMFVANVGLSCCVRNGDYSNDLDKVVQDVCDAIDYAKGSIHTEWGAKRAAAGHPEPFPLKYVELGNEQSGDLYAERYNELYARLKKLYPEITFICTLQMEKSRNLLKKADMIDPHWYADPMFFHDNADLFDKEERGKYEIYVGEFATITAANMQGALAEAAFITGMERNGDLVTMASEAPLIENSNHRDWPTNLIWVNNEQVMGRTSYYVQKMFGTNVPSYNLQTKVEHDIPTPFKGFIGFVGNRCKEQYRNIRITDAGGKELYKSNDLSAFSELQGKHRGMFSLLNPSVAILDKLSVGTGTVEFEACALEEPVPADMVSRRFPNLIESKTVKVLPKFIFGADRTVDNYFTLSFGDPGRNALMAVNRTIDGVTSFNRAEDGTSFDMEIGKWYKLRVEMADGQILSCSVDGQKIYEQEVHRLNRIHVISGYDEVSGETIIKVVNGTDKVYKPQVELNCSSVENSGMVTVLKSSSATDENTFQQPLKIVPITTRHKGFDKHFSYAFAPNSFTILRIKTK